MTDTYIMWEQKEIFIEYLFVTGTKNQKMRI